VEPRFEGQVLPPGRLRIDRDALASTDAEIGEILNGIVHPLPRDRWVDHLSASPAKSKMLRATRRWWSGGG
jgi:hypothetical protein